MPCTNPTTGVSLPHVLYQHKRSSNRRIAKKIQTVFCSQTRVLWPSFAHFEGEVALESHISSTATECPKVNQTAGQFLVKMKMHNFSRSKKLPNVETFKKLQCLASSCCCRPNLMTFCSPEIEAQKIINTSPLRQAW